MLNIVDKNKVLEYFNKHALNDMNKPEFKQRLKNKSDKDILEYFIEYITFCFKKDNFSDKLIEKFLISSYTFLDDLTVDKITLDNKFLEEIKALEGLYQSYLARTNKTAYKGIVECIAKLNKYIDDNLLINDSVSLNEVEELKETLDKLKKELLEKEQRIKVLEESNRIKDDKIKHRDARIKKLLQEIEEKTEEVNILKKEIDTYLETIKALEIIVKEHELTEDDLNSKISELEEFKKEYNLKNREFNRINNDIYGYIRQVKILQQELDKNDRKNQELLISITKLKELNADTLKNVLTLNQILEEKNKEIIILQDKLKKEENLKVGEELIIKSLFDSKKSIQDLKELLKMNSIDLTCEQIKQILIKLKTKINIEKRHIILGNIVYSIEKPSINKNKCHSLKIPDNMKVLNLLFVADEHIDQLSSLVLEQNEAIMDYCIVNNINQIINLGDFLDFSTMGYNYSYETFKEKEKLVEELISKLPKDSNIHHAILGGNHEESNLYLGKDFLEYFIDNRDDYISLGYSNCLLKIKSDLNNYANLVLAHPDTKLKRNNLEGKVPKIFKLLDISANKVYFSFLGHSHLSLINTKEKVCVVSSLSRDQYFNGALHVQLYFNKGQMDYMLLKPLVLSKKLIPVSEIHYRK